MFDSGKCRPRRPTYPDGALYGLVDVAYVLGGENGSWGAIRVRDVDDIRTPALEMMVDARVSSRSGLLSST